MVVKHSSQSNDSFVSVIAEVVDDGFRETLSHLHKHITQFGHTVAVLQGGHCGGWREECVGVHCIDYSIHVSTRLQCARVYNKLA